MKYEKCKAIAEQYTTLKDFRLKSRYAYATAIRNNWIESFPWLERIYKKHDVNKTRKLVEECGSSESFREKYPEEYTYFKYLNKLEDVGLELLPNDKETWTYRKCYEIARRYNEQKDFRKEHRNAYEAAYKHKWLQKFDWLKKAYRELTEDEKIEIAKKYHSKSELFKEDVSIYHYLRTHGLIDQVFYKGSRKHK